MSLIRELGHFVAAVSFERLPEQAVAIAKLGFTDCVATMIAGAHESAPQLLRQALAPAAGPATLLFARLRRLETLSARALTAIP